MSDAVERLIRAPLALWLAIALTVIGLDQVSKAAAEQLLVLHRPVPVLPPIFDLMLTYNEGAAFSLLGDAGGWQRYLFIAIAVAVSVVLFVWLCRLEPGERLTGWGISLVLGGAIGNLIDRVLRDGRVVDFVYLHYDRFHWPAFNVADTAICIGAAAMVLASFRSPREQT